MPMDPTKLFAQSEVCLFGWLISQTPAASTRAAGDPPATPQKLEASCLFAEHTAPADDKKGTRSVSGASVLGGQTKPAAECFCKWCVACQYSCLQL